MKTRKEIEDMRDELINYEMERCSKKYKKFTPSDFMPRNWGKIRALSWVLGECDKASLLPLYPNTKIKMEDKK